MYHLYHPQQHYQHPHSLNSDFFLLQQRHCAIPIIPSRSVLYFSAFCFCHFVITSPFHTHKKIQEFARFLTSDFIKTLVVLIVHGVLILQPLLSTVVLLPIACRWGDRIFTEQLTCSLKTDLRQHKHDNAHISSGHLIGYCKVLFHWKAQTSSWSPLKE